MFGRRALAAAMLIATVTACSGFTAAACGGSDDQTLGLEVTLPKALGGLAVAREKAATKKLNAASDPKDTYQCDGVVYSLRDGEELRGVLQVTRLAPDARIENRDFLRNLVGNLAGSVPQPVQVGDVDVFKVSQNSQLITSWFQDHFMFFLTVREDETIQGLAVDVDFDAVLNDALKILPA